MKIQAINMAKHIEKCLNDFIRHVNTLLAEDDPAGNGFHREFRVFCPLFFILLTLILSALSFWSQKAKDHICARGHTHTCLLHSFLFLFFFLDTRLNAAIVAFKTAVSQNQWQWVGDVLFYSLYGSCACQVSSKRQLQMIHKVKEHQMKHLT